MLGLLLMLLRLLLVLGLLWLLGLLSLMLPLSQKGIEDSIRTHGRKSVRGWPLRQMQPGRRGWRHRVCTTAARVRDSRQQRVNCPNWYSRRSR